MNDNLLPGTEYFKITLFRQLQEKMCVTRIAPAEGVKIPHYMELSKTSQMDQYNWFQLSSVRVKMKLKMTLVWHKWVVSSVQDQKA